jgi:tetratricopeptide (TPR) repeat protein
LYLQDYQLRSDPWWRLILLLGRLDRWLGPAGLAGVVPGTVSAPVTAAVMIAEPRQYLRDQAPDGHVFLRGADLGPPANPVLMVRASRRAAAASPADADAYSLLGEAYHVLWQQQEQPWVNRRPQEPESFLQLDLLDRQTIRLIQWITALNHFIELSPDPTDLRLGSAHWQLADAFLRMNYRDLALEHYDQARNVFAAAKPRPGNEADLQQKRLKALETMQQRVREDVQKRRKEFDLKAAEAGSSILRRFELALLQPYKVTDENNRVKTDPRGSGLALLGLELLRQVNPSKLTDEERSVWVELHLKLLLTMGRVREAREFLTPALKPLGPGYYQFEAVFGAAVGDYVRADQALGELETSFAELVKKLAANRAQRVTQLREWLLATLAFDPPVQSQPIVRAAFYVLQGQIARVQSRFVLGPDVGSGAGLRTLRGLLALEHGDTSRAAAHFDAALRRAGPAEFFPDRPLVERYLRLLKVP